MPLLRRFRAYKLVSAACLLGFLFILSGWLWAYFALRGVQGPLVLHWSSARGITQIGGLTELGAVAFLGALATVLNLLIALELEARDWFWGKLVGAFTLFLGILLFIGFAAIISVNG